MIFNKLCCPALIAGGPFETGPEQQASLSHSFALQVERGVGALIEAGGKDFVREKRSFSGCTRRQGKIAQRCCRKAFRLHGNPKRRLGKVCVCARSVVCLCETKASSNPWAPGQARVRRGECGDVVCVVQVPSWVSIASLLRFLKPHLRTLHTCTNTRTHTHKQIELGQE